jgi:hypothetical protein
MGVACSQRTPSSFIGALAPETTWTFRHTTSQGELMTKIIIIAGMFNPRHLGNGTTTPLTTWCDPYTIEDLRRDIGAVRREMERTRTELENIRR